MRTKRWMGAVAGVGITAALVVGPAQPAATHTPHDVVVDLEVSPRFEEDQRVWAIVRADLLRSDDGGDTWIRLVRGLDHEYQLRAIEVSAADPDVLYAATRGDGIYRSEDGGSSWTRTPGQPPSLAVRWLAVSPTSVDVLFATVQVGEQLAVVRTDDGGRTWATVADAGPAAIVEMADDDPAVVVVGGEGGEVRLSRDGGATWEEVLEFPDGEAVTALAARGPVEQPRVFAATREGGFLANGIDGAPDPLDLGIGEAVVSIALSPDFERDNTLSVSTWTTGVLRSNDGGMTYVEEVEGLTTNSLADDLGRAHWGPLRVTPGSDSVAFLGGFDGLFRAPAAGGAWTELETTLATNITSVALSPEFGSDQTLAVATYINGASLSSDGGRSWTAINDGLGYAGVWTRSETYFARLLEIGFSPTFGEDDTLFSTQRGYLLRSEDAGGHWSVQTPDGLLVEGEQPPDFMLLAHSPDYARDQTSVAGTGRGKVFRSTDAGVTFEKVGVVDRPIQAIVTSPGFATDRTVVVGTTSGLRRSADGGETWERMGLVGRGITSVALAPDFAESGRLFVGTNAGLFTREGRDEYQPITGGGLTESSRIEAVALSPAFERDATILVSARGLGLFRSVDGGRTFSRAAPDLLTDGFVLSSFYFRSTSAIVFSPDYERDRTVFGTAETTLLKSTDGGETWTPIAVPVNTHDTDPDAAPSPLLPIIDASDHHAGGTSEDDGGASLPIVAGAVLVVVLALGALMLVRRRRQSG